MRLKRVRIFGFKTFADRVEFNLSGGVVAVVGPNGCGKSNLVDAILWGLGEGNARMLRAQTGQDVIFNGSSKRKAVGFCEVSLLFDNEDRKLPIEMDEVTITRKLSRSGDSEYSINKQVCRQRDIYELLADSGLGRAGYSIVGQKEIDAALSASAEDRRAWIDEAAGVQRYRARKSEAQRRLSQANEHLSRVSDITRELDAQREPLREEAEAAARFKQIQGALREVEVGLLTQEIGEAVRELTALETKIKDSGRITAEQSLQAQRLEAQMTALGAEISEIEQKLDILRADQQQAITDLERAQADLRLAQQRLESLSDQEANLETDAEASVVRLQQAEQELIEAQAEVEREKADFETLHASLAGVGAEANQLRAKLREAESALAQARKDAAVRLKHQAEALSRTERTALVRREIEGIVRSLPDLEAAVLDASKSVSEAEEKLVAAREEVSMAEEGIRSIQSEEDKDAQGVRNALAERAAMEGRVRGIESTIDSHEGLTQGTRAVLEAMESGELRATYVPVSEAIEADKEMALAIETALGGSGNDLIADDPADAKAAIEWLKQRRAGRATFQPIPLMRPQEVSYELRRLLGTRGIVGRASELVKCSAKHRPVIDSLLGRVLVAEDIDTALDLAKNSGARGAGWSRVVTLEGEVVHASGAVTGGQQARQGYGMVQRKADLAELNEKLASLQKSVGEYDRRKAARLAKIAAIQGDIQRRREAVKPAQQELNEAQKFLSTLNDELRTAQREQTKLTAELERLTTAGSEELGPIDLAPFEQAQDEALRALAAKSADSEQSMIRMKEAEARSAQAAQRLYGATRRLGAAKDAEAVRLRRSENLEPEREKARGQIGSSELRIEKAKAAREKIDAELATLQTQRRTLLEESLRLADEAKNARDDIAAISDGMHKAELQRARAESRRATAAQRLFEEYGILEEDALENEGILEVPEDAASVVNRLRREMRQMGDVNLGAVEAYERVTLRLEELTAQRDDILSGIEQVDASIRELDNLTRSRFVNTFEAVQKHFSIMFERLFGGGEGQLVLSDPEQTLDSGIDILVTLPGKKRQQLNLLSGGERALCTCAFLFSLLTVKPSPLVVLDEVDAPLDGRNVERFAEGLAEFGANTQFIVITHNPSTIASAPIWLGVTMQDGVSTLLPPKLPQTPAPEPALT